MSARRSWPRRSRAWPRRMAVFARCRSGVAAVEFALAMPVLLTAGLYGVETANFIIANMRIGQLATKIADDASRIGDQSMLQSKKIYESDIDDLIVGAAIQAGSLELLQHGRVIVSSLETPPVGNTPPTGAPPQYIHWQRCKGLKAAVSSYGIQGQIVPGMGSAGNQVTADAGDAVMFVEISYDYQPLISQMFVPATAISSTAAFNVRDSRDLTQVYQRDPARPAPVADCTQFSA